MLIDEDKLFSKYISILSSQRLKEIIVRFENLTSIANIGGAIDGTYIFLANLPNKKVTLAIGDFFNRKSSIVFCCKPCVMQKKSFGTLVLPNLEGYMMVAIQECSL